MYVLAVRLHTRFATEDCFLLRPHAQLACGVSHIRSVSTTISKYHVHCCHSRVSSRSVHMRTASDGTEHNRGHLSPNRKEEDMVLQSSLRSADCISRSLLPRRNSPSSLRVESHREFPVPTTPDHLISHQLLTHPNHKLYQSTYQSHPTNRDHVFQQEQQPHPRPRLLCR